MSTSGDAREEIGRWCFEFRPFIPFNLVPEDFAQRVLNFGKLAECDDEFVRRFGAPSKDDLLGMKLREFCDPGSIQSKSFWRGVMRSPVEGYSGEAVILDATGIRQLVDLQITRIHMNNTGHLAKICGLQKVVSSVDEIPVEIVAPPTMNSSETIQLVTEMLQACKVAQRDEKHSVKSDPALWEKVRLLQEETIRLRLHVYEGNGKDSILTRITLLEEALAQVQNTLLQSKEASRYRLSTVLSIVSVLTAIAAVLVTLWK